jgi:hypothetical protein
VKFKKIFSLGLSALAVVTLTSCAYQETPPADPDEVKTSAHLGTSYLITTALPDKRLIDCVVQEYGNATIECDWKHMSKNSTQVVPDKTDFIVESFVKKVGNWDVPCVSIFNNTGNDMDCDF